MIYVMNSARGWWIYSKTTNVAFKATLMLAAETGYGLVKTTFLKNYIYKKKFY